MFRTPPQQKMILRSTEERRAREKKNQQPGEQNDQKTVPESSELTKTQKELPAATIGSNLELRNLPENLDLQQRKMADGSIKSQKTHRHSGKSHRSSRHSLQLEGVTFPAMHVLLSKWAPPAERSVMAALVYAGTSLGTVISMLMAGGLTATLGWESVFYVMGGLSAIWCVLWVFLVQDSPQQQPLISAEERNMIVTSLGGKADDHGAKAQMPVPWKAVLTSPAFLAILVAHACSNWGWYMLLIETPFYMKQVLKFNMAENTVTTALPFLSLWIFSIGLSRTLDWLREKKYITTTTARKIGTLFASLVPGVCLLALCYVGCARGAAVALMAVGVTCIGGMFCGFLSNHIDIAPNFAGTLMAMTNTVATIPGIVVPIFVGVLTHGNQTISAWRVIFFVTIGLYCIEIIVYTLFGSGEEQPWNRAGQAEDQGHETKPLNNSDEKNSV